MDFDGKTVTFNEEEMKKLVDHFKTSNIQTAARHELTNMKSNAFGYIIKKGNLTFEFVCLKMVDAEVCSELLIHGLGYESVLVNTENKKVLYDILLSVIMERETKVRDLAAKNKDEKIERFKKDFFSAFDVQQNTKYDLRDRRPQEVG